MSYEDYSPEVMGRGMMLAMHVTTAALLLSHPNPVAFRAMLLRCRETMTANYLHEPIEEDMLRAANEVMDEYVAASIDHSGAGG